MKWITDENGKKYVLSKDGRVKMRRPELRSFSDQRTRSAPWYVRQPCLHLLVQWLILLSQVYPVVFSNDGKFKPGDRVVYNWKAWVQIWSVVDRKNKVQTVSNVCYRDRSGLDFISGDSCDCFWVRKAFFWEK